jgi:hypothetical protein
MGRPSKPINKVDFDEMAVAITSICHFDYFARGLKIGQDAILHFDSR